MMTQASKNNLSMLRERTLVRAVKKSEKPKAQRILATIFPVSDYRIAALRLYFGVNFVDFLLTDLSRFGVI